MKWYLHSAFFIVSWGPFPTEQKAWAILLGREVQGSDVDEERRIGWRVDQVAEHPVRRKVAA